MGALVRRNPVAPAHMVGLCFHPDLLTLVNLRGVREIRFRFMLPTYAFVGTLFCVLVAGLFKTSRAEAIPAPVAAPPVVPVVAFKRRAFGS